MSGEKKYVVSREYTISNPGYDGIFWLLSHEEECVWLQDIDMMGRIIRVPDHWIKEAFEKPEHDVAHIKELNFRDRTARMIMSRLKGDEDERIQTAYAILSDMENVGWKREEVQET